MKLKILLYNITHWEAWDWRLKYIPLLPAWFWYALRSGSLWFFTPSNPSLVFGGFDGVSKKDMYSHLPPNSYPKSVFIDKVRTVSEVEQLIERNRLTYPVAVKPETGRMGFMFRKINTREELKHYHETMPVNYILQEYIHYPIEVSVFYYRFPDQEKGRITGFVRKESMQVTGDGKSTLRQLITKSPRARLWLEELKHKHAERLNDVFPAQEIFPLSHALNLSRGGKLVSLEHEKDERLLKVFDDLSNHSKHFYFGRYDIKCASIDDLKNGANYSILEYNGSGGEPHHVYGNGNSLFKACNILRKHWSILYKISRANNEKGVDYWNLADGWNFFKEANKHVRMLKKLDAEFPA